jgi:hypothetical protein
MPLAGAVKRPDLTKRPTLWGPEGRDQAALADFRGDLPGGPRADGPPGIRRGCTRDRDHLDHLVRRKRGGRTRAWVLGQGRHDHGAERFVTALVGCQRRQLGGQGEPPLAPHPSRPAIEVPLAPHVALIGSRCQRQQHLGTSHQTLGTGLTSYNLRQTGSLACRQLHPGGNGRGPMSIRAGGLSHF